ncbi:MAG: phage terminase large subunit [Pyrinomonadaceae bacterium]
METQKEYTPEMIEDCKRLFLKFKGRSRRKIEAAMKLKGWTEFRSRWLYPNNRNGQKRNGWIEDHGWHGILSARHLAALRSHPFADMFPKWLRKTMPQWQWNRRHQKHLYRKLRLLTERKCRRLMIFLPPRHGKSELVTVRYAAWRLETDPTLNVIIGSYNQKLANRFSRKIRRIAENRISISRSRRAADEWETTAGGGVRAVGVGAGITGFGGGLVIIDDPVKSRAEANSKTFRDNVWDWFNDDIYTRLEPEAAVVLIQTRWHDDDLAGRLLREAEDGGEAWDVVCLPALAEAGNQERAGSPRSDADPLNRLEGEALWPQRYDRASLLRIKRKLGAYSFAAMYQQRPMPREGGLFKREWFTKIVDKKPEGLRWCRGYDLAVSTKTSADYTASFRCAMDKEGNLYIADGFRKRIEFPEQCRFAIERMTSERDTNHGIELALHGQALMQDLRREVLLHGVAFRGVKVDGDKHTRALPWANLAEEGKVYLVKGAWIDDFLEEVCRFTGKGDKHDDQVDAVSLAVQMFGKGDRKLHKF